MDADPEIGGWWCPAAPFHVHVRVRPFIATFVAVGIVLLTADAVHAEGRWSLRQGIRLAETAEFEGALEAFDDAEASEDLRQEDLVRLYGHRAVVLFALDRKDGMEADLARLLAVDPQAALPDAAPPPVRDALRRMADLGVSPPRLVVEPLSWADGIEVRATVEGGPPGLVRRVRVFARVRGASKWSRGDDKVAVLVQPGVAVEWYAEAIGPGGAPVVAQGSRESPESTRMADEQEAPATDPAHVSTDDTGKDDAVRRRRWWLLGTGATAVVGAAVVTAVLLVAGGGESDATQVARPTLVP
ncbi:MAG: hypothetical protein ACOCV4_04060 [Myxococcota bacterium]